jgi:hypothetical protein
MIALFISFGFQLFTVWGSLTALAALAMRANAEKSGSNGQQRTIRRPPSQAQSRQRTYFRSGRGRRGELVSRSAVYIEERDQAA